MGYVFARRIFQKTQTMLSLDGILVSRLTPFVEATLIFGTCSCWRWRMCGFGCALGNGSPFGGSGRLGLRRREWYWWAIIEKFSPAGDGAPMVIRSSSWCSTSAWPDIDMRSRCWRGVELYVSGDGENWRPGRLEWLGLKTFACLEKHRPKQITDQIFCFPPFLFFLYRIQWTLVKKKRSPNHRI